MTQETLGYVELEWTCQYCGGKNPGTVKVCGNCGAAMAKDQKFEAPAQQQLIKDEEKLKQAQKGPDIHCPACGTRNPAEAVKCSQCGSELKGGAARQTGQVIGAYQERPAAEVKCAACGTMNPGTAANCKQCNAPLGQTQPGAAPVSFSISGAAAPTTPVSSAPGAAQPRSAPPLVMYIVGGALALLCLCGLGFFIFQSFNTSDVAASVQSVFWERVIGIEAQRPAQHEAWQDQIPQGADVGRCERKFRQEELNPPSPGADAEKVCGTAYVVDQGSGAGKVVQDCKYRVYDQSCEYTVLEWREIDKAVANGSDLNPQWPPVNLQADQREGERREKYAVTFDAQGKSYDYGPNTAQEFVQFSPGSHWTLKVNGLGGINAVEPAR